jgi:hypothetical protein
VSEKERVSKNLERHEFVILTPTFYGERSRTIGGGRISLFQRVKTLHFVHGDLFGRVTQKNTFSADSRVLPPEKRLKFSKKSLINKTPPAKLSLEEG